MFRLLLLLTLCAVATAENFQPVAGLTQNLVDTIFAKRLTVTRKLAKINQLAQYYDFGADRDQYYLQVFLFEHANKLIGEQKEQNVAKAVKDSLIAEFLYKKQAISQEELDKRLSIALFKATDVQREAVRYVLAKLKTSEGKLQEAIEKVPVGGPKNTRNEGKMVDEVRKAF